MIIITLCISLEVLMDETLRQANECLFLLSSPVFSYVQLINILESCWSKEPALSSSEVHLMLDNCLTEVAL